MAQHKRYRDFFPALRAGLPVIVLPVSSSLVGPYSPLLLSIAVWQISSHVVFIWLMSFIIVSLHVILPLFLFSVGIQCRACLARLTFSIRCTWPDHLGLIVWSVHSSSDWLVFLWKFSLFTLSFHVVTYSSETVMMEAFKTLRVCFCDWPIFRHSAAIYWPVTRILTGSLRCLWCL